MSERSFVVTVAMAADGDRASLAAMASILHRRGVELIEADFSRPTHGLRLFSATFVAAPPKALTVLRSFEGLVDVVDATLYEAFDTRHVDVRAAQTT